MEPKIKSKTLDAEELGSIMKTTIIHKHNATEKSKTTRETISNKVLNQKYLDDMIKKEEEAKKEQKEKKKRSEEKKAKAEENKRKKDEKQKKYEEDIASGKRKRRKKKGDNASQLPEEDQE